MANNKTIEFTRSRWETELVEMMALANQVGLNSNNMDKPDYQFLYDELYSAACNFFQHKVIPKCKAILDTLQLKKEDAATICATKLFFDKLDTFLLTPDIPLIIRSAKNCLIDLQREELRHQGLPTKKTPTEEDTPTPPMIVHLDEGWNLVASQENLEDSVVLRDMALMSLHSIKDLDLCQGVCFLGTKFLGYKASALAKALSSADREYVCRNILQQTALLFCDTIPTNFFDDIDFSQIHTKPAFFLSSDVSHASDRFRKKLQKSLETKGISYVA